MFDANAWAFLPGLGVGDYYLDGCTGPDGDLWLLWYNGAAPDPLYLNIYASDLTTYDTYTVSTGERTSYTGGRAAIIVTRNNLGIVAYQEGSITGGVGTWVRSVTRQGTVSARVLANENYTHNPVLCPWNGCEDAVSVYPGTGVQSAVGIRTSDMTLGTVFNSMPLASLGVLFSYTFSPSALFVDPKTNRLHLVISCSTKSSGAPSSYPIDLLYLIWDDKGFQDGNVWEPPNQVPATGTYYLYGPIVCGDPLHSGRVLAVSTTNSSYHMIYGTAVRNELYEYLPDTGWSASIVYAQRSASSGYVSSLATPWVRVDAGGHVHMLLGGTDCPEHHSAPRTGYTCGYLGCGAQYIRWVYGSSVMDPWQLVLHGNDVEYGGSDKTLRAIQCYFPRGYPTNPTQYALLRSAYDATDRVIVNTETDLWEVGAPAAPGQVNCGAQALSDEENHSMYVLDDREFQTGEEVGS